jgi:RNA polymerase sigma-70 factor (ECF subfamily)
MSALPEETLDAEIAIETWAGLDELRPVLSDYLARHCRDENEAEDVIQEAMIRASRYRRSLADPKRLRPWVLRIALNVLRDLVRRERRLPRTDVDDDLFDFIEGREEIPGESGEERQLAVEGRVVEKRLALHHLGRARRQLREPDQTVLETYYAGAESCRETARVCEIEPGLVKVRLYRARRRLLRVVRTRLRVAPDPWEDACGSADRDGFETCGEDARCASPAATTQIVENGAYGAGKD